MRLRFSTNAGGTGACEVRMLRNLSPRHGRSLATSLHYCAGMNVGNHAPVLDRVRANTWPPVNDRLDAEANVRLRSAAAAASSDELTGRMNRLEHEWDFDRTLETEASLMGLFGLALGVAVDRRLLMVSGMVSAMLLLHATHGWYPLLPIFRRAGVRTRDEIDRERYGLKALRGDFMAIPPAGSAAAERAAAAWKAVCE